LPCTKLVDLEILRENVELSLCEHPRQGSGNLRAVEFADKPMACTSAGQDGCAQRKFFDDTL
jgi:hypothetical protein